MGTRRIEISQQRTIPLVYFLLRLPGLDRIIPLRINHIRDGIFDSQFRVSVGVCRTHGAFFGDGDHVRETGRIAVDSSGTGEDDIRHIMLEHGAEETDGSEDIDAVVFEGDFGGFADGLVDVNKKDIYIYIYKKS